MSKTSTVALGLDFGTESVCALLVDLEGSEYGVAVKRYRHGQIVDVLPTSGQKLPPDYALQHPQDWLESSSRGVAASQDQLRLEALLMPYEYLIWPTNILWPRIQSRTPDEGTATDEK